MYEAQPLCSVYIVGTHSNFPIVSELVAYQQKSHVYQPLGEVKREEIIYPRATILNIG